MMQIENKFDLKQTVYLRSDKEQLPRIVTAIWVKPSNLLMYELSQGSQTSDHYDFEITDMYNLMQATSN